MEAFLFGRFKDSTNDSTTLAPPSPAFMLYIYIYS